MPRSDEPAGIPREMLQDTLIDVMAENDRLRARSAELEESNRLLVISLTNVMTWIDGWSPDFTDDPEWAETNAAVWSALGGKKQ